MIVFDRGQGEIGRRGKSALDGFSDNTQYFILTRHHHHPVVSLPTQQNYSFLANQMRVAVLLHLFVSNNIIMMRAHSSKSGKAGKGGKSGTIIFAFPATKWTQVPTHPPSNWAPLKPTTYPTKTPTTAKPSAKSVTAMPTNKPDSAKPTGAPVTSMPTASITTAMPSLGSQTTTSKPTTKNTAMPTKWPDSKKPSKTPTRKPKWPDRQ